MTALPRLLFIGFHSRPGKAMVPSQNQLQSELLRHAGYDVKAGSDVSRPMLRLAHQLALVARYRNWADAFVVDAFSGRRFWTAFLVTRAARLFSLPSVVVLHGGALPRYAEQHPWRVHSTLGGATRVVAPSPFLRRQLNRSEYTIGDQPNLVETALIEGGVDGDTFGSRILWMRAFDHDYQPHLALETFAELVKTHPSARMTMAGPDGGLLADSKATARSLGVDDRVDFPGLLEPDAKLRSFCDHDLFLNTTRVDNTPVSVIEAMAAGLPVVATDVGGLSDLIDDGVSGILVPDGDAAALAVATAAVLDDVGLRRRLIDGGHRVARAFTPAAVTSAWDQTLTACGVVRGATPTDGYGPLGIRDLEQIVEVHQEAFPDSAMTKLGAPVVNRYYRWQFIGPHPAPVALGVWREGQLVGMLFGGRRRGAVAGFVRRYGAAIAATMACHPRAVRSLAVPKVVAVTKVLRRRPTSGLASSPPVVTGPVGPLAPALIEYEQSFGVLSVAVRKSAQGTGAAAGLLEAAERAAIDAGLVQMNLTVQVGNGRATRFYEKLGWERQITAAGWKGAMSKQVGAGATST